MNERDLLEMVYALHEAVRDEGRRIVLPHWVMSLAYVVQAGLALLAAKRTRCHPSRFRRYMIRAFALVTLLCLPARADDPAALGRMVSTVALALLMLSMAMPPSDLERFQRYIAARKGEENEC